MGDILNFVKRPARCRRVTIGAQFLVDFLKDPASFGRVECNNVVAVENPLPRDVTFVCCYVDPMKPFTLVLFLHSAEFEEVPEGAVIPEIMTVYRRQSLLPVIQQEEVQGLLCEADHAEKTGHNNGMVLLTPEFTKRLVGCLRI